MKMPEGIKVGDTFKSGGQTWKVAGLGRTTGGGVGVVVAETKSRRVNFSPEFVKQRIEPELVKQRIERRNKMGTKTDYEFEVKRSTLVKLYGLLGFKTADKWDCKKFEKKVKSLPEYIGQEGIEFQNEKAQKFVDGVLKALDEGKTIVVVDEHEDVDSPEPKSDVQEELAKKEIRVAKSKKKTKTVKTKEKKKVSKKSKKTEVVKPKIRKKKSKIVEEGKSPRKMDRIISSVNILTSVKSGGISVDESVRKANALCIEHGIKDNLAMTTYIFGHVLRTMCLLDLLEVDGDLIRKKKG